MTQVTEKGTHALLHAHCKCGSGWMIENVFDGYVIRLQKGWNICKRCGGEYIRTNFYEYNNEYVDWRGHVNSRP